ncbi:MAG TPA: nuclear transport factor 2 family protein [Steroidobacteraceae bacterium]|nr:nuclear transport factor 2 family protein [Steroidobacteraceae bacterium]
MNTTSWRTPLLTGLLVSGLLACTAPAADSERTALEAAIHRWTTAVNTQNVAALTATMTEDVELLDANAATVSGRDAAIGALRQVVTRGRLIATSREIKIANEVAWHVVGLAQAQKNGDVQARGQSLEIWKRENGEWKLHRRMTTGVTSPDVSVTRPPPDEPVLDRPRE